MKLLYIESDPCSIEVTIAYSGWHQLSEVPAEIFHIIYYFVLLTRDAGDCTWDLLHPEQMFYHRTSELEEPVNKNGID